MNHQKPKVTIFYYSGTGNSLWAARALARELGNTELISMVDMSWRRSSVTEKQGLASTDFIINRAE